MKTNYMAGRPTEYSEDKGLLICSRLISGESLRSICKESEMPVTSTVLKWLHDFPSFSTQYTRAKEAQMEGWQESLDDLADEAIKAVQECEDPKIASAVGNAYRLKIDTRKWAMSKLAPKKYGDKLDLNHGGSVELALSERLKSARASLKE